MTIFGARSRARTFEFGPGDVGYVPLGYGHFLENIGDEDVNAVLVFNSATYQDISASAWFAGNSPELLAVNFGVSSALFTGFPKQSAFIAAKKA
jgi:oxalate decarboxylase